MTKDVSRETKKMIEIKNCPICGKDKLQLYLETKDYFLSKESFTLKQCNHCGFVFTSPRPEENKLKEYYHSPDYLSHHSSGTSPVQMAYKLIRRLNIRKKYQLVQQFISKGSILDIGCGTGELLSYLNKRGWEVTGIEPNNEARNFAINNNHISVHDEKHIPNIINESFDVVTMWHVLEHVSDINHQVSEVYRILKHDGIFIVALPNPLSWDALHYKECWAAFDVPRHLYHFMPDNIIQLSEKQKFKHVLMVPMMWDSFYVSLLSEKYLGVKFPYIKALINGYRSNRNAKKGHGYSSMIYIFKKS